MKKLLFLSMIFLVSNMTICSGVSMVETKGRTGHKHSDTKPKGASAILLNNILPEQFKYKFTSKDVIARVIVWAHERIASPAMRQRFKELDNKSDSLTPEESAEYDYLKFRGANEELIKRNTTHVKY